VALERKPLSVTRPPGIGAIRSRLPDRPPKDGMVDVGGPDLVRAFRVRQNGGQLAAIARRLEADKGTTVFHERRRHRPSAIEHRDLAVVAQAATGRIDKPAIVGNFEDAVLPRTQRADTTLERHDLAGDP